MEYQSSPFEPIRSFDAPGVALQQILSDNVSVGSIRDLLTPSRRAFLTPEEQASIAENFKDKYGGDNRVLRTMLGIATNPWIWMGAMLTPAGVTALKETGSIFLGRGLSTAKGIKGGSAWLDALGVSTSHQALNGTLFGSLAEVDDLLRKKTYAIDAIEFQKSLARYYKSNPSMLRKHGIKEVPTNIDEWMQVVAKELKLEKPHKFTSKIFNPDYQGVHKEWGGTINRSLYAELSGMSKSTSIQTPSVQPTFSVSAASLKEAKRYGVSADYISGGSKPGRFEIDMDMYIGLKRENDSALRAGAIDQPHGVHQDVNSMKVVKKGDPTEQMMLEETSNVLRETLHLDPIINAYRASYDKRAIMLFANQRKWDDHGIFELDPDKIKTLSASMDPAGHNSKFFKTTSGEVLSKDELSSKGVDFLRSIFDIDHFGALAMSSTKRERILTELMEATVVDMFKNKTYIPRNTYRLTHDVMEKLPDGSFKSIGIEKSALHSSSVANAETLSEVNRLAPRTTGSRFFHPHDYQWLREMNAQHGGSSSRLSVRNQADDIDKVLKDKIRASRGQIKENTSKSLQTSMLTMDAVTGHRRYMKDTSEIWSRHIPHKTVTETGLEMPDMEVYGPLIVIDEAIRKQGLPAGGYTNLDDLFLRSTAWRSGNKRYTKESGKAGDMPAETWDTTLEDLIIGARDDLGDLTGAPLAANAPDGGVTIGDIMAHTYASMKNTYAADIAKDVLLPYISSRVTAKHSAMRSVQLATQENLASFANSWLGKKIETFGQPGKDFINSMKTMSTYENITSNMAKGLYVGFLGLNMSSVMLNMMQPLLHAAMWGGLGNVMPAYLKAFSEIAGYAADRAKLGWKISSGKRAELNQKHFKHIGEGLDNDLLGVQPDVFANIEGASYAGVQGYATEGNLHYLTMTLPMKLFEKAELMNRLTTAHMVDGLYKRAGIVTPKMHTRGVWNEEQKNLYRKMIDTKRMVQEAQFGGTVTNMPTAFIGHGPAGGVMSNALSRQFLSFLARAATSFGITGRQISPYRRIKEGVPFVGGKKFLGDFKYGYAAADFLRVMGTGALVYEIGKEMTGMDMSRGLGFSPMIEVMGGGWKPPIVSIPYDFMEVISGDLEFAKSSIPGVVPGGIGIVRAMGMLPKMGDSFLPDWTNDLQKTYVDWNTTTPDGAHPIYKPDGSLINYEKPFTIVTRGLGINMEDHPKAGEVDGYLVKQREMIIQMESDYINAVLSNNIPKAKSIEAEFQKRFNLPMKISKRQWKARLKNLQVARLERIADTIPAEYKHLYQGTLQDEHSRLGLQSPEDVMLGTTSGKRTTAGAVRPQTVNIDSKSVEEIRQHLRRIEQEEKPIEDQGFNPFQAWNQ